MFQAKIIQNPNEVEDRLSSLGLSRQKLINVAIKAITAKSDATKFHPVNAPGSLAHIYGVGALREEFVLDGTWLQYCTCNIEGIINDGSKDIVLYQNVHEACAIHPPKAISNKGKKTKELVENNPMQMPLHFPELDCEMPTQPGSCVWHYCVSEDNGEIRAELSQASSVDGDQFDFHERIFVVTKSDWTLPVDDNTDADKQDFDVQITWK